MKQKDLPIGYWIKKADELLTQGINQIQAKFNLTRTEWQILNAIKESKQISKTDLTQLMQPFADGSLVENALNRFKQEEFISINENLIYLTPIGRQIHQESLDQQIKFREQSVHNITDAEYQTTVSTLQKLVANLEK